VPLPEQELIMNRRQMLKAGLGVPGVIVSAAAVSSGAQPERQVVITEAIFDDKRAHESVKAWARLNGLDPFQWGLPLTVKPDAKTITGPYHPDRESLYAYERTVPLRVQLPSRLAAKEDR
jgi:hypothetical protein